MNSLIVKAVTGFGAVILCATCSYGPSIACAQDAAHDSTPQTTPERPTIHADRRSEEDWSVLTDPRVAREPLDGLKYIPLVPTDPKIYLSLGVNVRERLVLDHATFFGTPPGESGDWILSRLEWHADLRLGKHLQIFTQFTNAIAPGNTYGELRGDWTVTPHYAFAFDAVHYVIGTAIRQASGHDAKYLSVQVNYGW